MQSQLKQYCTYLCKLSFSRSNWSIDHNYLGILVKAMCGLVHEGRDEAILGVLVGEWSRTLVVLVTQCLAHDGGHLKDSIIT